MVNLIPNGTQVINLKPSGTKVAYLIKSGTQVHTVQVALYFRGLLSIRGRLVEVPSKRSLQVQKPSIFLFWSEITRK